jgi:adenylosuccinate lyase
MIPRYSRPEMARIWEPETRFRIWLRIETYAAEAMAELGLIPKHAADAVRKRGGFDINRIDQIEREVKHDVIAFLTSVAEHVGPEARFLHSGLTSSDVLDTCFNVQLVEAADLLIADIDALLAALKTRAFEHKDTVTIGRSHGVHAEPTTFGLKLAVAYAEFARARERLVRAREEVATCAISGAVGTFAHVDPRVEAFVAKRLGLRAEPISTQVVPRDRHAEVLTAVALAGASLERLATEIRHLQRTEVREAEEPFKAGQKGSSAMPHKRNPITSERVTGLARLLRGYAQAGLENVALWHERDISHSSVERVALPDATTLLHYMQHLMARVVDGLRVHVERMRANVELTHGALFSQSVLTALVEAGLTRDDAYRIVQRNAQRAWDEQRPFRELLEADPDASALLEAARLDELFDYERFTRHAPAIIERLDAIG